MKRETFKSIDNFMMTLFFTMATFVVFASFVGGIIFYTFTLIGALIAR